MAFSSDRERRLWLCALAVAAAIYASLGLASVLAGMITHPGISAAVFLGFMVFIGLTIITQGLRVRPGGREIGVGLGIAVVYLFVFFRMTIPVRSHLIEYSVLAVFIYEALAERSRNGRHVPIPAILAIVVTALVGVLDEGLQLLIPSRVFDPGDMLFNALAAVLAVICIVVLRWIRTAGRTTNRANE